MKVDRIENEGQLLAIVVRAAELPSETTFVTPSESILQVGYVVRSAGGVVERHVHKPLQRTVVGTPEVLVVSSGACEVDVYTPDRRLVTTKVLQTGDVLVMTGGGHGFRMTEDTVLFEVKQGPYPGVDEKERF